MVDEGDKEKGLEMINKAFDSWKVEYEMGWLSSHISWFIACAKYLGKYDYAMELESSREDKKEEDGLYSSDNLASSKLNELEGL